MGHIIVRAAFGVALALGALSPALAEEKLRVATEASFPPFSQTEPDGSYTGFEIDLGNDVCRRIQVTCEWIKQDFDGMIPALQARKYDMIFSSMSIKPERQKVADFSIPYYAPSYRFYARKGTVTSVPDGLKGKPVGVYAGATQEQYLNAKLKGVVEPRGYGNIDQIHADLVAGRIDVAFNEAVPAAEFLHSAQGKDFEFVGPEINDPEIFGPGAGAMFRKGDPLRDKVNNAVKAAYADGTFDRLSTKYFPGVNIRADKTWQ